jgi:glycosyltransferase involved in cell wall biosynthesis
MKIAQVAPLQESVPPKLYGGTERVVYYLTEELVRLGHQVTLFASGDSRTSASLHATVPQALRLDSSVRDYLPYAVLQIEQLRQRAQEFDMVHFHGDYLHLPLVRAQAFGPVLTTLHGRLDFPDYRRVFEEFRDAPLVSIADHQRGPLAACDWAGTVYHGLPENVCQYAGPKRGEYLAFLGRISPEKRPDRAIEIATRAGMPLKIAAKVDKVDHRYFETEIEPLLARANVEFVGEIGEHQKSDFLGGAHALLFPIDWPEPFGLVMIEAMSCGTPVIGWRAGSVPEVIDEGESGFIVDSIDAAVAAVQQAANLSRARVRACFERRFTAARMARDYVALYEKLLARRTARVAA